MRTALIFAMLVAWAAPAGAQERLADQLRKGVVEEEVNQNTGKAIQAYQAIVARYDEDRKAAGTALYRLAECYRRTGKRDQAIAAYQRVTREFADQTAIVEPSRQQLAALGIAEPREVRPDRASTGAVRAPRETPREVRPERGPVREVRPEAARDESLADAKIRQADVELRRNQVQLAETRLAEVQQRVADAQRLVNEAQNTKQRPVNYDTIVANLRSAEADWERVRVEVQAAVLAYERQLEESQAQAREAQDRRLLNERMMKSVEEEIKLVQQRIKSIEQNVKIGKVSELDPELLQLRRDLLGLQRKLDELRLQHESIRRERNF